MCSVLCTNSIYRYGFYACRNRSFRYAPLCYAIIRVLLTHIVVFGLPFFFLYILRNNKKQFYAATAVFAVGFLGVVITTGRVAYVFTSGYGPIISLVQAWAALEQSVGIIVCCLPAFR